MKQIIAAICFTSIFRIQTATSQYVNRPPNLIYNRPETIVEAPLLYPLPQPPPVYQPLREVQPLLISHSTEIQPLLASQAIENQPLLNPTTIITDCTPTVCKNLIDVIQLMSVVNLIKDKNGGADIALQLAEPYLKEALSNPLLAKPIAVSPNYVGTNLISPIGPLYPNFAVSPNVISNVPIAQTRGVYGNTNAMVGNLLTMLGN